MRTWSYWILLTLVGTLLLNPMATRAQEDEPTVAELQQSIANLEDELAQAKERRNYYQDRVVELKEENAQLKARVAELETPTEEPAPTSESGMIADERAYLLASRDIIGPALVQLLLVNEVVQDPDFANDYTLWLDTVDALQPMHSYWQQIQLLTPPPRLVTLHQTYLDILYNADQCATYFELGVTNLDVTALYTSLDYLSAMTESIERSGTEIANYESVSGVDISEELPEYDWDL